MKILAFYENGCWRVSLEAQFSDEPGGTHPLSLLDAKASKVAVVYAAARAVAKLSEASPPNTIFDQRHWRVAGPRKWQFTGARPRTV